MRVEVRHRFRVPLAQGFAYITALENWPAYWPGLVSVDPASRWSRPGDEARVVVRLLGRRVPLRMTLKRFEPPRLVEYVPVQPGLPEARHLRLFASTADGFELTIVVEGGPRAGARGLLDRTLVRWALGRRLEQTGRRLERALPRPG